MLGGHRLVMPRLGWEVVHRLASWPWPGADGLGGKHDRVCLGVWRGQTRSAWSWRHEEAEPGHGLQDAWMLALLGSSYHHATGLPLADLQKMKEYLGVEPENDAQGVLQDVHWSYGLFG